MVLFVEVVIDLYMLSLPCCFFRNVFTLLYVKIPVEETEDITEIVLNGATLN